MTWHHLPASVSPSVRAAVALNGLHIRAGCFFGTEAAFVAKLAADDDAHKTACYMAALVLSKLQLRTGEPNDTDDHRESIADIPQCDDAGKPFYSAQGRA